MHYCYLLVSCTVDDCHFALALPLQKVKTKSELNGSRLQYTRLAPGYVQQITARQYDVCSNEPLQQQYLLRKEMPYAKCMHGPVVLQYMLALCNNINVLTTECTCARL